MININTLTIGQQLITTDNITITYKGIGLPGSYPGMQGIQETIIGEYYENGIRTIGTYFLFQIKEN